MPEEGATENIDPNETEVTSAAEANQPDSIRLKGVSWQDNVDGKSLFTVSSRSSCCSGVGMRDLEEPSAALIDTGIPHQAHIRVMCMLVL